MLSVILPAYNEEKNIEKAIKEIAGFLRGRGISSEIIVVNDGSKDNTQKLLEGLSCKTKDLIVVNHPQNLGYGAVLRSGFAKAKGDLIFFTDSDNQFDIREIGKLLENINNYDFAVGYRKNRQDPFYRKLYAFFFKFLAQLIFGIKVKDIDCAFKLFKADVIKSLPLSSSGALINLEIFALAKKKGYKFIELPVIHLPRKFGRPTGGSFMVIFKALFGIISLYKRIRKMPLTEEADFKKIVFLSLVVILGTLLSSFVFFAISQNYFPSLQEIFNRWDAPHYINIAQNGYQGWNENKYLIIFFPFYPYLVRFFYLFFRNYFFSALFVSNLSYIIACLFFYKLVLKDFSKRTALRTVFYFSIFPTAYFLHLGYSEALFLALSFSSLYCARDGKWHFSGLLAMLASLTRLTGIVLFPVLLIEYLAQKKFKIKEMKPNILWSALPLLGFITYLLINYLVFGDIFMFSKLMEEHWYKFLDWPWVGFKGALAGFEWRDLAGKIMVSGAEIFFALFGFVFIAFAFKYLRLSYGVYAILNWLIITSTSFWLSIPRYTLSIFPLFIVLAILCKEQKRHYLITVISLMFYMVFLFNFIGGRWAF